MSDRTCDACWQGRHIRCQDKLNCACTVCGKSKRKPNRLAISNPNGCTPSPMARDDGVASGLAHPKPLPVEKTTKPRQKPGPKSPDEDEIRQAVLKLVQRIAEKVGVAA